MIDNRPVYRCALQALHAYDATGQWFEDAGFDTVVRVQRYTAAGWFASCPSEAVVATAGTVGPGTQPRFALQWLDHVNFAQRDIGAGRRVHSLWDYRAQGYALDVAQACSNAGVTDIHLVGHSYGAALSLLLPRHLLPLGVNVLSVTTFGCPRVGNPAYAASLAMPIDRVERDSDLVPFVPISTPLWLLSAAWALLLGPAGLFVPHGPEATSYSSAGELVWCGDDTDPPRRVTNPLELAGLQLQRIAELVSNLVVPGTAFRVAGGHLMDRYLSHVSIPVP